MPGVPATALIPAIILGDKIDDEMPSEPLIVQFVKGPTTQVAEKASFAPFVNANGSVDGKSMVSQISSVAVQPPLRLDVNPQILVPKMHRPSKKGIFLKGAVIMHQISRAAADQVDVELVGLGVNPCIPITSPLATQGVAHLINQAAGGHLVWIMPLDISNGTDLLIASVGRGGGT